LKLFSLPIMNVILQIMVGIPTDADRQHPYLGIRDLASSGLHAGVLREKVSSVLEV
jgi:hypothetical protein